MYLSTVGGRDHSSNKSNLLGSFEVVVDIYIYIYFLGFVRRRDVLGKKHNKKPWKVKPIR